MITLKFTLIDFVISSRELQQWHRWWFAKFTEPDVQSVLLVQTPSRKIRQHGGVLRLNDPRTKKYIYISDAKCWVNVTVTTVLYYWSSSHALYGQKYVDNCPSNQFSRVVFPGYGSGLCAGHFHSSLDSLHGAGFVHGGIVMLEQWFGFLSVS